jgi:hypothetical protein
MVARLSLQLFPAFAVAGCNRGWVEMLPRQSRRSEFLSLLAGARKIATKQHTKRA